MGVVEPDTDYLNIVYQDIVDSFDGKIGNCILLLGPELAVNDQGIDYKTYFKNLSQNHVETIEKYFEDENLFAFQDGVSPRRVIPKIKNFYKTVGNKDLLNKIAQIKFPLIINFSPDLALRQVFEINRIDFTPGHFSRSTVSNNSLEKPSKDKPILYNILGSIDADGSLILDHGHMHQALEKLLAERSLPDNIEAFLKNANTYVFLGFNYESWYYQLLCHRLNIKTEEHYSILSTPDCRDNDYTNRIMGKHFRMDFTGESALNTINRIINTCRKSTLDNSTVLRKTKYGLSFSYAWKDKDDPKVNRETIVDYLEKEIRKSEQLTHHIFRDKLDLMVGDNLKDFMDAISECPIVIQVVSNTYLKSKNCMYEALKIHKNSGNGEVYKFYVKENENDRVVLNDIRDHWKKVYDEESEKIVGESEDKLQQDRERVKRLDWIREIIEFIPELSTKNYWEKSIWKSPCPILT